MGTNKLGLKTVDEFVSGYTPVYQAIFLLFLSRAKQYAEYVGTATTRRLEAVGDIRMGHQLPKQTEIKQVAATLKDRVFKKYFLASQFIQSELQDSEGIEDVVAQVLDENFKLQDDLLFLGEGTSASTMINNGLFWSNDPNYVLETSDAIANNSDNNLSALHSAIMDTVIEANKLPGKKILFVYGSAVISRLSAVYASSPVVFRTVLEQAMGPNWEIVEVPSDVALTGQGWIAVNMQNIMFHYTVIPTLQNQGVDEKNMESWHNFLMGSCMLEVLAYGAIRRQPVTFS